MRNFGEVRRYDFGRRGFQKDDDFREIGKMTRRLRKM
jgi:hypothetical protein